MKIEFADNRRLFIAMIVVLILFGTLVIQLANLTIVNGTELSEKSDTRKSKEIVTTGSRGTIMDSNGIPLAYDQKSYDVVFYKDYSKSSSEHKSYYTQILMRTIEIIQKNNGVVNDTFSIKRNADGQFVFDFGITNQESVAKREKRWREDMYVQEKDANGEYKQSPEDIYTYLRARYQIPSELSYEDSRLLLSIWQEVQLNASKAYLPVVIANDVDMQTVAELETYSLELEGVEVREGTIRVYPKNDTAAHIIGYMGKMVDDEVIAANTELGYSPNDKIGVAGIEASMELTLTPNIKDRQGKRNVEVNNRGQIMREISKTQDAKSGNSVMLTLDIRLQLQLEKALKDNIKETHKHQEDLYYQTSDKPSKYTKEEYNQELLKAGRISQEEYDANPNKSFIDKLNLANSGAAVVMDVNTGKVLAIASYPSYNLNSFANGISEKDYEKLKSDPATPLFDKAVSSKSTPGSIFKMSVAMGALMDGKINLGDTIDDGGEYRGENGDLVDKNYKGKLPSCWVKDNSDHANQSVEDGIANSCDYFFYTLAERLGITRINYWANQFGLDEKTNIELPHEATGQIGDPLVLYDSSKPLNQQKSSLPVLVYNVIKSDLKKIGEKRGTEYSETELANATERLMKLVKNSKTTDSNPLDDSGSAIRRILREELSIPEARSQENRWSAEISDRLSELVWGPYRTILTGIGQEQILITPLEAARYTCAIANKGTVFNASIIDKIISPDGSILETVEPSFARKIEASDSYWNIIQAGMNRVTDDGTLKSSFKDFEYTNKIAAKSGTAQVSKIDLENNAWFVSYIPNDKPEIAIVVFIPNGYAASETAPTAKSIIKYYMEQKDKKTSVDIPTLNSIIGGTTVDNTTPSQSATPTPEN